MQNIIQQRGEVSINQEIENFWSLDFEVLTTAELEEILGKLLNGYATKQYSINPGGVLVRGRINKKSCLFRKNILFSNSRNLWYPLPDDVRTLGRFNDVSESYFYCSKEPETVLRELKPKTSDWITILECEIDDQVKAPLFLIGIKHLKNVSSEFARILEDHATNKFHDTETQKQLNLLLDEFINDLAQKEDKNYYKATNAIARIYLQARIAGLLYPSIATKNHDGTNFVFKTDFADANIRPYHAVVYEVIDKTPNSYFMKRIYESHFLHGQHGRLNWKKLPENIEPPAEYVI